MASGVRMKWYGREVEAEASRRLHKKLLQAGELVRGEVVRSISTSYHTEGPSKPGEPPHARNRKLGQSYMIVPDGDSVLVGSPLKYAFWLEVGTSVMEARPHLRVAVYRLLSRIKQLFRGS